MKSGNEAGLLHVEENYNNHIMWVFVELLIYIRFILLLLYDIYTDMITDAYITTILMLEVLRRLIDDLYLDNCDYYCSGSHSIHFSGIVPRAHCFLSLM